MNTLSEKQYLKDNLPAGFMKMVEISINNAIREACNALKLFDVHVPPSIMITLSMPSCDCEKWNAEVNWPLFRCSQCAKPFMYLAEKKADTYEE